MDESIRELNACRSFAGRAFEALCYAPFAQLHFTPDGDVAVCSKSTQRILGNVREHRILDLWRGPALESIRTSLRGGAFAAGCEYCERHLRRQNVRNNPLLDFDPIDVHADGAWPSRLEFAFSDLCNLACMHCSPELSSVLRARAGLSRRPRVYDDAFFAQIEAFLPHARSISLLGGEPLLHDEAHRLSDLASRVGSRAQIHVTTNGTVWNERVERMLGTHEVAVSVSIDGATRRTFERVRIGANHGAVMANLRRFRERLRGDQLGLRLNFCLMKANWFEFADLLLLAEELDAPVWVTLVTEPRRLSLFHLRPHALERVIAGLEARSGELRGVRESAAIKWREVLRTLRAVAATNGTAVQGCDALRAFERGHAELGSRLVPRVAPDDAEHDAAVERRVAHALQQGRRGEVEQIVAQLPFLRSMGLTWLLKSAGEPQLAMEAAQRVRPDSPDHVWALLLRAEDHMDAGRFDAAAALLDEARRLPHPPLDLFLRTAWLCYRQRRIDEGLAVAADLARGLAAMASPPAHLANGLLAVRSNLLRAANRYPEAIRDLEELMLHNAENPQNAEFLALVRAEAENC
jgi:MoaA/NifB/PqqE/SkfB family radical SAM enzyme